MKKIIQILLITTFLFAITACGPKNNEKDNDDDNKEPTIEEMVENKTIPTQGDIELINANITSSGSINIVTATLRNNGTSIMTFDATLYMKNEEGLTLGKLEQKVENLHPGDLREIKIEIMGDYTTVNSYELIIENQTQ